VKVHRALQLARVVVATVMMAAWFVASDHCALASALAHRVAPASAQEHCPGHPQPGKKNDQEKLPCCKSLFATAATAKVAVAYDTNLFVTQPDPATDACFVLSHRDAPGSKLDTGPPPARTFAESVLQRSILAHAPPFFA